MKIGILTFHSQLNYGGVLQCWALKTALEAMRHDVTVIDRWITPDNWDLERGYNRLGLRGWCWFVIRSLVLCGDFSYWLRHRRTKRYVKSLGLTPCHFHKWSEVSSQPMRACLDFDTIVVGSDQVWRGGDWNDPRPYLLEGAPAIHAIAYAASFGLKSLPLEVDYAAGFGRFAAISCRESEGVELVRSQGYQAVHVVDPTLLISREQWHDFAHRGRSSEKNARIKKMVCYFLSQDVDEAVEVLYPWAKKNGWNVEIICDQCKLAMFPKNTRQMFCHVGRVARTLFMRPTIKLCYGYGPKEFVRAFSKADACLTDSFHAVMFSSIFDLNLRFLRPQGDYRKGMFARIEEFVRTSVIGDPFVENVAEAHDSFFERPRVAYRQDVIEDCRGKSASWLRRNICCEVNGRYES